MIIEKCKIDSEYIKLGQVLKLIGVADSGVHAKIIILNEEVKVNDKIEVQRGKKIYKGDTIEVKGYGIIEII